MGKVWDKSGLVELDNNGQPADGAIANFFVGGTSTPLTVFQDSDEGTPHEEDVEADANGRWPVVFIPFTTSYDVRVQTEGGTQLYYHQEIPNPNPVEAAEDTVDATELIATGHVHWEPVSETKAGYVRLNGRTIGNAASGASERANADTEDLFTYLWNNVANAQAAVSGGRGGSAAADYAANKTITLLDGRSGVLRGLDDMGNSGASRLGSAPFTNGDATTPGSALGANTNTILEAHLPAHAHTVSITTSSDGAHTHTWSGTTSSDGAHTHTGTTASNGAHTHFVVKNAASNATALSASNSLFQSANVGTDFSYALSSHSSNQDADVGLSSSNGAHTHTFTSDSNGAHTHTYSGTTSSNGAHTHTVSGNTGSVGSGTAHNIVSYGLLGTFYQKL